jgi:plasmid stabilization system protein ParE
MRAGIWTLFPSTERNPDAARRVGARIRETINLLVAFPDIGHEGALSGTREMVVHQAKREVAILSVKRRTSTTY